MKLVDITVGPHQPLFLIAGPCVLENRDLAFEVAQTMRDITSRVGIPYIFKSSFDKANRTSAHSFRGPGLEQGPRPTRLHQKGGRCSCSHRCARGYSNRRSCLRRRCFADPRFSRTANQLYSTCRQNEETNQHQKGSVSRALGYETCGSEMSRCRK